jgi:ABC-type amino acid transport system permease subunit
MQGQGLLDVKYMLQLIPRVAAGIPVSLSIAFIAFLCGIILGFIVALVKFIECL